MTIEQYREVLKARNLDCPLALIAALGVISQMEHQRREYEEDMNELDKQQHEAWFHAQDQEMGDER